MTRRGYCRDTRSTTAGTSPAAIGSVVLMRISPAVGLAKNSVLLDALAKVVKHDDAPLEQRFAIQRRLDPQRCAIKQARGDGVFEIGNRLRHRGLRHREIGRGFSHAAPLRHGHEDMQIAQLQSPSDPLVPGLGSVHD